MRRIAISVAALVLGATTYTAHLTHVALPRVSRDEAAEPILQVFGPSDAIQNPGDGNGWAASYDGTPPTLPGSRPITIDNVARSCFDSSASTTAGVCYDSYTLTNRIRQAVTNVAGPTGSVNGAFTYAPGLVSLSDYSYAGDVWPDEIVNNSSVVSPLPIVNWVTPDRNVVGDSLYVEVECFHRDARNGQQCAKVIFSATDGTSTVTALASGESVSSPSAWTDKNPVVVYGATLNLTGLANGAAVTVNACAYPWRGTSASVACSASAPLPSGSVRRQFTPRYYWRDNAWQTPTAYCCNGSDTTGAWSASDSTAYAAPFATLAGAVYQSGQATRGITANSVGTGYIDGATIYLTGDATLAAASKANKGQKLAALTITACNAVAHPACAAAPSVTVVASVNLKFGNALARPPGGGGPIPDYAVIVQGLRIVRNPGSFNFSGPSANPATQWTFINDQIENSSNPAAIISAQASLRMYGGAIFDAQTSAFAPGSGEIQILRGVDGSSLGAGSAGSTWENYFITGTTLTNVYTLKSGPRTESGTIQAFNKFLGQRNVNTGIEVLAANFAPKGGAPGATAGGCANDTNIAIVQNIFEWVSGYWGIAGFRVAGDSNVNAGVCHLVMHYNTFVGGGQAGDRANMLYDTSFAAAGGAPSVSDIAQNNSLVGNITAHMANKSDVFDYYNMGAYFTLAQARLHTQAWSWYYGVGWSGNLIQYQDCALASGACYPYATWVPAWLGLDSLISGGPVGITHGYAKADQLDPQFAVDGGSFFNGGCGKPKGYWSSSSPSLTVASGLTGSIAVGQTITFNGAISAIYVTGPPNGGVYPLSGNPPNSGNNTAFLCSNSNGPGGSDVHVGLSSPARTLVPVGTLSFDLDGAARSAVNDTAGTYR